MPACVQTAPDPFREQATDLRTPERARSWLCPAVADHESGPAVAPEPTRERARLAVRESASNPTKCSVNSGVEKTKGSSDQVNGDARLEVDHVQLDPAVAVPLVHPRGEGEAAVAAGGQ
jgi:hypothetical protein